MPNKSEFPTSIMRKDEKCGDVVFDKIASEEMSEAYRNKKLPINLAQEVLKDLAVVTNSNSWVSSARRGDRSVLKIGTESVPAETVKRWGWGAYEAENQIYIKASHEYAHYIQDFFDKDLANFLDNEMDQVREKQSRQYLELYTFLVATGRISGLPEEEIYQRQTEDLKNRGSLLDMRTYEDMAEVIGAWMLGEEYYNFRLDNSKTPLSVEKKNRLTVLIGNIFEVWVANKSKE